MASEQMVGFSPKTRNHPAGAHMCAPRGAKKKINIFFCRAHARARVCATKKIKKKKKFFFLQSARSARTCAHMCAPKLFFFQKIKKTRKNVKKTGFFDPLYFWDLPPKGGGGGGGELLCLRLRWQKTGFFHIFSEIFEKKKNFFFSTVCTRARACAHQKK